MSVFSRFRAAADAAADPLGMQAAIDRVATERDALTEAQRRLAQLDAELTPAAKESAMATASNSGRVGDLLASRKAQDNAEVEREVLGRFIPTQHVRIRQAQERLQALRIRRSQAGQALQILAMQAGVAELLSAIQHLEDAAEPFARWSNNNVWDVETNPLLLKLDQLRRYLVGNEPGDWSTLTARATALVEAEPEALAIAMSDVDRESNPPPGTGLW